MNGQSGPCGQPGCCLSQRAVHTSDLFGVNFQKGVFQQDSIRNRVYVFFAVFRSCAYMPLFVENVCALFQKETVDSVMPRRFPAACVDAASGYDGDISPCAYIKIIVDKIINPSVGYAGRDINRLFLCFGAYMYYETGSTFFCLNAYIRSGTAARTFPVFTDIESTAEYECSTAFYTLVNKGTLSGCLCFSVRFGTTAGKLPL